MIAILKEIQNWLKRIVASRPSSASPKRNHTPRSAGQARGDRASSVTALQKEVRALQQEITDIMNLGESGGTANRDPAHEERLASLRSQLAQKQTELARFQARI